MAEARRVGKRVRQTKDLCPKASKQLALLAGILALGGLDRTGIDPGDIGPPVLEKFGKGDDLEARVLAPGQLVFPYAHGGSVALHRASHPFSFGGRTGASGTGWKADIIAFQSFSN